MLYTYYKIENIINHNLYIGITTQPERRKNTHFNKLRQNNHRNPLLQRAYNKYGSEAFVFQIIEEKDFDNPKEAYQHEADLIELYDTFNHGYNCNPGGEWTGKRGRFSKQDIFYLNSVVHFRKNMCTVLSRMYQCPRATIYSAVTGRTYTPWYNEFQKLSEEEKRDIFEEFCDITNFKKMEKTSLSKQNTRKYTKEQVFLILYWSETRFISFRELASYLHFTGKNHFENIRQGRNYKDYYYEYQCLSETEKQQIECAYRGNL